MRVTRILMRSLKMMMIMTVMLTMMMALMMMKVLKSMMMISLMKKLLLFSPGQNELYSCYWWWWCYDIVGFHFCEIILPQITKMDCSLMPGFYSYCCYYVEKMDAESRWSRPIRNLTMGFWQVHHISNILHYNIAIPIII